MAGAAPARGCGRAFSVSQWVTARLTPHGHAYAAYAVCRASRMRDTACVRLSVNHEHFEDIVRFFSAFEALR